MLGRGKCGTGGRHEPQATSRTASAFSRRPTSRAKPIRRSRRSFGVGGPNARIVPARRGFCATCAWQTGAVGEIGKGTGGGNPGGRVGGRDQGSPQAARGPGSSSHKCLRRTIVSMPPRGAPLRTFRRHLSMPRRAYASCPWAANAVDPRRGFPHAEAQVTSYASQLRLARAT